MPSSDVREGNTFSNSRQVVSISEEFFHARLKLVLVSPLYKQSMHVIATTPQQKVDLLNSTFEKNFNVSATP